MPTTQEPQQPQNQTHKVAQGETLKGIATRYKLAEQYIWNHPENRGIVSKRGKPEKIQRDDTIIIPPSEKELQEYRKKLEEYNKLLEKGEAAKKRLGIVDKLIQVKLLNIVGELNVAVETLQFYWSVHNSLYNEQNIVGWLLHNIQGMPSPLPVAPLNKAKTLAQALRPALNARQFDVLASSIPAASDAVAEAHEVMINYQAKIQVADGARARNFTCVTISFALIKTIDTLNTIAIDLVTMAAATSHVEELEAFANKLTHASHTPPASKILLVTATIAGITGLAARDKGWPKRLLINIAKKIAPGVSFGNLSKDKIANLVVTWLENAGKPALEDAVEQALRAIKSESATVEEFVSNVAKTLVPKIPINGVTDLLDKNLVSRATAEVQRLITKRLSVLDKLAKLAKSVVKSVAKRVLPRPDSIILKAKTASGFDKLCEKALEEAIASAKSPRDIADRIVSRAMSDKGFLSQMEKQIEQLVK